MFAKYFPHLTVRNILMKPGLTDVADDLLTSSNDDYNNLADFFAKNNPAKTLHKIRCPVLVLQSLDDPIINGSACTPYEAIKSNPNLVFAETLTGGHIG
jgi:predicted alpha/beta-fold hydrolase